jgi:hypothetical protein
LWGCIADQGMEWWENLPLLPGAVELWDGLHAILRGVRLRWRLPGCSSPRGCRSGCRSAIRRRPRMCANS